MTENYTIIDMVVDAHETALEKGWWRGNVNIPEKLALVHSETSEALEDFRNGNMKLNIRDVDGKPEGFATELADIVIRVADLCGYLGIDLEYAILVKMEYNKSRSFRHGGKKA